MLNMIGITNKHVSGMPNWHFVYLISFETRTIKIVGQIIYCIWRCDTNKTTNEEYRQRTQKLLIQCFDKRSDNTRILWLHLLIYQESQITIKHWLNAPEPTKVPGYALKSTQRLYTCLYAYHYTTYAKIC